MIMSGCRFLRTACPQVLSLTRKFAVKSPSPRLIGFPESAVRLNHCKYERQIRCCHTAPDGKSDDRTDEMSFDEELKQLTVFQRYKKLAKEYWYILIPVHCCTSIFWFGSCLLVVYTGVDVDLVYISEMLHLPEGLVKPLRNPNLGKLAVALMLYKLVSPLRYMSTVYAAVPSIKYLVRRKLIKPVPRLTSKKKIEEEISRIKFKITKKRGED